MYTIVVINPELEFALEISPKIAAENSFDSLAAGGFYARWRVSDKLSYFEGHFPGFPVLPGVATVDVTLESLRRALKRHDLRLSKLQNAKFLQPIQPGDALVIDFSPQESQTEWKAEWKTTAGELVAELTLGITLDR